MVNWFIVGPIIAIYVVITFLMYLKNIRFLGIGLYPFGITILFLNGVLNWIGQTFESFWKFMGKVSYFVVGNLMLGFVPLLLFSILGNYSGLYKIPGFNLLVVEMINATEYIELTSAMFLSLAFISIALHELLHGVVARANNIPIENVGIIGIPYLIFAAYVKIDLEGWLEQQRSARKEDKEENDEEKSFTEQNIGEYITQQNNNQSNKSSEISQEIEEGQKNSEQLIDRSNDTPENKKTTEETENEFVEKIQIDGDGQVSKVKEPVKTEANESENDGENPLSIYMRENLGKEFTEENIEESEEPDFDPLAIRDKGLRQELAQMQSAGLFINVILLFVGIWISNFYSGTGYFLESTFGSLISYSFLRAIGESLYAINLLLIGLNLLPIIFTDGGKILINKAYDLVNRQVAKVVQRAVIYFGFLLLFIAIIG